MIVQYVDIQEQFVKRMIRQQRSNRFIREKLQEKRLSFVGNDLINNFIEYCRLSS